MKNLLDSSTYAKLQFRLYRHRFLLIYMIVGVTSLWIEVLLLRGLQYMGVGFLPAQILGLCSGVMFAFWMNARFNFKIPLAKRNRALLYFAMISTASLGLNFVFKQQLSHFGWSYEQARFAVSASLFSFAYLLHRRFSFVDRKQVGVAVYANGVEDIRAIREKIGDFSDFIHVDLIDASFGAADTDVRSYRLETIQAYWPRRKIHVHLMTRHPSRWLKDLLPFADVFIVHQEIDDDLGALLDTIQDAGKQAGLALTMATPLEAVQPYLGRITVLMLLTIKQPGRSGQKFEMAALERIQVINQWERRREFALCVDGGVNTSNIHLLNLELVVSGSAVLESETPARQIMRLQTSSNYEAV
jgi:ribulose-phosphate 3-epimerase